MLMQHNLNFVALYGSFFNGNPNKNSDIDLIIDAHRNINSEEIEEIQNQLEKIFNRKVDIITLRQMNSSLICGYVWRLKEYEVVYNS